MQGARASDAHEQHEYRDADENAYTTEPQYLQNVRVGSCEAIVVKGFYVRLSFIKSTYGFNKNMGYNLKDPFDPRNTLSLEVDVEWLHLSGLEIKDLVVNVPATHTRPSAFSTVNLSEAPVEPSSFWI